MIQTYRYATERRDGEGLRLGATRYPPRGVPLERCPADGYFDERIPLVAPSAGLLRLAKEGGGLDDALVEAYRRELDVALPRDVLQLLAAVHGHVPYVVGCFCEDLRRCHRRVLAERLDEIRRGVVPMGRTELLGRFAALQDAHRGAIDAPSLRALRRFEACLGHQGGVHPDA
jgi:uncharacterized protein YeaO (DUF488 family)